jgi:exopolysaccharide biosynthesis polyprenyl glycosylphosphotransferase
LNPATVQPPADGDVLEHDNVRQVTGVPLEAQTTGQSDGGVPINVRWCVAGLVAADATAAGVAAAVALWLRFGDSHVVALSGIPYVLVAAAFPPTWVAIMMFAGGYEPRSLAVGPEEYRRVANATVWFLAALVALSFVTRSDLSRGFVALATLLAAVLTLAGRYAARRRLRRVIAGGRPRYRVMAIGSLDEVRGLCRHLRRFPHAGFDVVAACVPGCSGRIDLSDGSVPVVSDSVDDPVGALQRVGADTIAIAGTNSLAPGQLRRLSWQLEGTGTDLVVAPSVTDVAGPRIVVRPVQGLPLLHIEEPSFSGMRRLAKEVSDRLTAAVLCVLCLPLLLTIAVAIRFDSPGPLLFRQVRLGQHGRSFVLWKFRTMSESAERQHAALTALNETDGALFKIRDDPRVTRAGRVLRRLSLDELPQLWNVITGSMSLIGPRPLPLASGQESMGEEGRRRLLVKPGMTGLWQVSGRSDLSWEDSLHLDLYYIENWSVTMDAVVLWKTVGAVLGGRGAY